MDKPKFIGETAGMSKFTRRAILGLFIATGFAGAAIAYRERWRFRELVRPKAEPIAPPKPEAPPEMSERLARALNDQVPEYCEIRFTVPELTLRGEDPTQPAVKAVVEMHWPPGLRQRTVDTYEGGEDAALQELLDKSIATFRPAWPDCFA